MSDLPDEGHLNTSHEWLITAQPDHVVRAPNADHEDELDWDQTTITMTIQGTLQSGYDLADAIGDAATFYLTLAHRDRHSNRVATKRHAELADRMSAIAAEMERQLNLAFTAAADASDQHGRNRNEGDTHAER